ELLRSGDQRMGGRIHLFVRRDLSGLNIRENIGLSIPAGSCVNCQRLAFAAGLYHGFLLFKVS
ncbi:MAG: hypothetical protein LBK55_03810, partial [Azoarcus sp.]|nr:hypothetical protein [Azoarcus sp.]